MDELSEEEVKHLAELLKFSLWENLTEEQKKEKWKAKTNDNYFSFSYFKPEGLPSMLVFKRVGKGHKANYILNLNTLKPTRKSPIQLIYRNELLAFKTSNSIAENVLLDREIRREREQNL
jgi:hypothetical protein